MYVRFVNFYFIFLKESVSTPCLSYAKCIVRFQRLKHGLNTERCVTENVAIATQIE